MNGDDPTPVFCVLAVLLIVFVVFVSTVSSSLQRGTLDTVAKRWRGYVVPGGFLSHDEVVMQIGDAFARLSYSRRGKHGRNTHLAIQFPDQQLRLELYAQSLVQQLRKLLGMHDIEIGAHHFDEAFIINGNNQESIREYLTASAQAAIVDLANFSTVLSADLHLTINGGVLRVTKHVGLKGVGELNEFITRFERMYHALAYAKNSGIEFVAQAPLPQVQETQCQVCGEPLAGKIVFCASCKTPHHHDCWQYLEQCAVYGCGQHRYTEPRRSA